MLLLYISGQWLLYQSSHPESTIEVIRPTKLTTTVNDDNAKCSKLGLSGLIVTCNMGPIGIYINHKSSTISGELCVQLHGQSKTYSAQVCPKPVLQQLHPLPLNY